MNYTEFLEWCKLSEHAIGHACPDCGNKWIFFEGRLDTLWEKINQPCTACGSTNEKVLSFEEDAEL